jgi:glutathione peroxidase-family protein
MEKEKKQRPIWEKIILVLILLAVPSVIYGYYHIHQKSLKEKTLIYQLQTLRNAVQIYLITYKESPKNLTELINATIDLKEGKELKLNFEGFKVDKDGNILDPFGNTYNYNATNHWINSTTQGYAKW